MKKNVTVIGHRGIAAAYPENTLISFEKAVEGGSMRSSSTCT